MPQILQAKNSYSKNILIFQISCSSPDSDILNIMNLKQHILSDIRFFFLPIIRIKLNYLEHKAQLHKCGLISYNTIEFNYLTLNNHLMKRQYDNANK